MELEGAELDKKVADILEHKAWIAGDCWIYDEDGLAMRFQPSTNWAQGGPLIEKYEICLIPDGHPEYGNWAASFPGEDEVYGETPLIAACRAIISASR